MPITQNDIQKLARLTRLAMSEDEQREAAQDMRAVLALIDQLKTADTDGIDPMARVQFHGATLRARPAAAQPGYPPAALQQNAPQWDDNHFLVPPVIE